MALLKSTWVLTAKLNEYDTFMFHYDCINLIDALDQFWHSDYPEHLIDCENNGLFPIDVIAMPDEDGMVEKEFHLMFNCAAFDHFFDKGWSASSKEPDERYLPTDFLKDIERKQEAEEENPLIYIRVLQHDTCDQVRIGESFPAWKTRLDKVVENTKKSYVNETPRYGTFENIADRFYRRVALVDAETLQSVREIYNNPDNKPKPLEL